MSGIKDWLTSFYWILAINARKDMKPVFAKVLENMHTEVFAVREIDLPFFSTEFHFHKECTIVYVVESEGKRVIGDSVESFKSDELIFLGQDIPHVWHNDKQYFEKKGEHMHARSIALFFDPERMLELLAHFVPVKKLSETFGTARRGMKFYGQTKESLKQLLFELLKHKGLPQLITLLKIFELVTHTGEYELLASAGYVNTYHKQDNDRIDKVFKYVFKHFAMDIPLDDVSTLANMNKQAFCRFFKSRTQRTFVQFVNDVRIGHACKLLAGSETQIGRIASDCGFNSLSSFNQIFKEAKGVTPREYKKMIAVE